jgi:hypothetical protein
MSIQLESRVERVEREDLVMFINACFACTGQREFYAPSGSRVGIDFLHRYIVGNYRRVYARMLAAGINHFNQAEIVFQLLSLGAPAAASERAEEGALIFAALSRLPPQRAYRVLARLAEGRVNNRRSRAVVRRFLASRSGLDFELVKYRAKLRRVVAHAHLRLAAERARFLFEPRDGATYAHPLFEACRKARYAQAAVYELPFTIAEGYAARHGIARDRFLANIAPRMTAQERLRLMASAEREELALPVDLTRATLTKLASYLVSLSAEEREARRDELTAALVACTARQVRGAPALGRVAAVLDNSYSASGSSEKRRRPLAVALAVSRLLAAASRDYLPLWTTATPDELLVAAEGQTDLARPLLKALSWQPDLVVIVSDGVDNAPSAGAAEVARVCRQRGLSRAAIVQVNPAFDGNELAPRELGPDIATVGLRDAESLFVALEFARFALGSATLFELEQHLGARVSGFLGTKSAIAESGVEHGQDA